MTNQDAWVITGISSGLGQALAEAAIQRGIYVVGTVRQQQQADAFNAAHGGKATALKADITRADDVKQLVQYIADNNLTIDVLVNNAGVGFAGAIEEASLEELRQVFEVNFFATVQVTQALLPLMRQRRAGHIIMISSHGGIKAFPGFGVYNASKFALEGISEALAAELAPLGIKVTLVEPGPFRTQFAGAAFRKAAIELEDYRETAGVFRQRMVQVHGNQEGNPALAAEAIIELTKMPQPPLRLPLGKTALQTIRAKIQSIQQYLDASTATAESVVFNAEQQTTPGVKGLA